MSVSFHVSVFEYCTRIIEALQGLNFNVQLLSVEDVLSVVATLCTIHQSQLVIGDSVDFNIVVGSVQQRYCHLQNRISPYQSIPFVVRCDTQFNSISGKKKVEFDRNKDEKSTNNRLFIPRYCHLFKGNSIKSCHLHVYTICHYDIIFLIYRNTKL